MHRNLHYISGWLLIISFSFSLLMHYPAQAFAEDAAAAPAVEAEAAAPEQPQTEATAAEKKNEDNTAQNSAENTEQNSQTGEGEALKPAEDKKKLSPEEAIKLRESLKIKSRRKHKQTKEKDAEDSVMKRIFDAAEGKEKNKDGFNIDYSPSKPDPASADEETPFYKHWLFWTIIGVGAVSGVVIGLKYGLSSSKSMSIDITRREP